MDLSGFSFLGIQVLNHACDSQLALKVLYVVGNDSNSFNLVKMLKVNGYTVFTSSNHNISDDDNSSVLYLCLLTILFSSSVVSTQAANGMLEEGRQKLKLQIGVVEQNWPRYECQKETSGLRDQCGAHPTTDLAFYETVIFPSFVQSIDNYVQILARMARHTINGVSHSFLTTEDAPIAGPLNKILEQCRQAVPDAFEKLASHMIHVGIMKLQFLLIITSSPFFIDPRMYSPEATIALSVPSFYPGRLSQMFFCCQFLEQPYKVKSGVNWPPSPSDQ
ncbi:hypothetical protein NC651_019472 [Populus alba x Populus x berolinensis]|nr:hypothetical protein NC651_019472 [Populus alba x Populus x berolinensis]